MAVHFHPQPKPRPSMLDKQDRRKALKSADLHENTKVKARSGGRCEMVDGVRCTYQAAHVHHLLGGIGVRGRGESRLAANKLHLCERCHSEIHAHILVPDGPRWRRVR